MRVNKFQHECQSERAMNKNVAVTFDAAGILAVKVYSMSVGR